MARIQTSKYAVFSEHVEIIPRRPKVVDVATNLRRANNTILDLTR